MTLFTSGSGKRPHTHVMELDPGLTAHAQISSKWVWNAHPYAGCLLPTKRISCRPHPSFVNRVVSGLFPLSFKGLISSLLIIFTSPSKCSLTCGNDVTQFRSFLTQRKSLILVVCSPTDALAYNQRLSSKVLAFGSIISLIPEDSQRRQVLNVSVSFMEKWARSGSLLWSHAACGAQQGQEQNPLAVTFVWLPSETLHLHRTLSSSLSGGSNLHTVAPAEPMTSVLVPGKQRKKGRRVE